MSLGFDNPLVCDEDYLPCRHDSEECVGQITADALRDIHRTRRVAG